MTQTTDRLAEVLDAIANAYEAGCQDVHDNYQPDRDPDFSEAARDYAKNVELPVAQSLSADLDKAQQEIEALRKSGAAILDEKHKEAREGALWFTQAQEWRQQLKTVLDREAEAHSRHEGKMDALEARIAELEAALVEGAASLAASLSILQRANSQKKQPRLVVASDSMFATMMIDYQKSLDRIRAALNQPRRATVKDDLKPCPFCGSDELSHGWSSPGFDGSMSTGNVECHNCNALIYTGGGEAEAIEAWNHRVEPVADASAALNQPKESAHD